MFGKFSIPPLREQVAAHQVCLCKLHFASFEHNSNCSRRTIAPIGTSQIQASQNFVQHMGHHLVTKSYAVLQMQLWLSSKVWIASVCERSICNPVFVTMLWTRLRFWIIQDWGFLMGTQHSDRLDDQPRLFIMLAASWDLPTMTLTNRVTLSCTHCSFNFGCSATRSRWHHVYITMLETLAACPTPCWPSCESFVIFKIH